MRKPVFLALLFLFFSGGLKAQIVTIADPNFVAFLQATYPSCMSGDQMDTQCPDVLSATTMTIPQTWNVNDITGIEHFISLQWIIVNGNQLTFIPTLPPSLNHFQAYSNNITSVSSLSPAVTQLTLDGNPLTSLSNLPPGLTFLNCNNTNLTYLPPLPATLGYLSVDNCNLYALPDLPPNLFQLYCDNNPNLTCLPILPEGLWQVGQLPNSLYLAGTAVTCIPNLPAGLFNSGSLPFCIDGDLAGNPNNCPQAADFIGKVYNDTLIANCDYDMGENVVYGAKVSLMDSTGTTVAISYSDIAGNYAFIAPMGTYTVELETSGVPYMIACPGSEDSTFFLSGNNVIDFPVLCQLGPDLGVTSVLGAGAFFPGQLPDVIVYAGDMSNNYNLNCASGVSGQVIIDISGPATYAGAVPGYLTPTAVSGNTLTYDIADFSALDFYHSFRVEIEIDTTATAGDTVCIDVTVTTPSVETDLANNTKHMCFAVMNSYDPNTKQVYPAVVDPGYDDWLTYTIHFQNTGNAPAYNIKLRDTLDALLKPDMFELLGASHPVEVNLNGQNALFKFDNIMLPDSTSDPIGSIGWIQYRIKPESGLPDGTEINNECYIFFDYNSPILTNTATTYYAVDDVSIKENNLNGIAPYPNPSMGLFEFVIPETLTGEMYVIDVCTMDGERVITNKNVNEGKAHVDLHNYPAGIYFMTVTSADMVYTAKLIKY